MYLHYDTETDGLNIPGQPSDHPDQPGLVSISAILDDKDGNELERFTTLVKPHRPISAEVTAIHGITTERAEKEGIPLAEAMNKFAALAKRATTLVAFNNFFDFKMLKIGCARMQPGGNDPMRCLFEAMTAICTMDGARKFLNAGRFIKLGVAHQQLFNEKFENAHQSMADTEASRRIFYHLKKLDALPEAKAMTRKVYGAPPPPYEKPAPAVSVAAAPAEPQTDAVAPVRPRPKAL